ncbi:recombinase family protein [Qipengyuania sp. HL-TH1]|jgi:DNA invertase Pin-like site-specific DNA recombinase|uniref:recombinase family protein n=2 Tax=Qipengyuania profunda TaxID=3113984 RepID=UPI002A18E652|nr:recombinase family protein [Qipengyuania sp. HL-TH1]WPL57938.1 recombinase family protein [Qipengyuania sp. HL-TH5]
MDCVVYMRWSSSEQSKGSTLERQRADCWSHAAEQGWRVLEELVDDGISAFKGEHAATGQLSGFVRDVEAGRYPEGVILLCEKLDRLSRQEPSRVFLWMMNLTEAGVTVATVDGARRYSKGNLDMAAIIEVIVKAQLSHEESEKKSQRLGAAWAAKRRRLSAGEKFVMTRRAPGWLEVVGIPPRFVPIPERVDVVRRIFEETVAGFGKQHIARNLNCDGVPTFGRASGWHASAVQKILRNPAVVGELHPATKPRGSRREATGEVVQDYYPVVVDADLHRRAAAAMAERSRRFTGRGRRLVNLFSGLARCEACGAKMTFRGKGRKQRADGSWVNEDYLVCDGYQRGRGCDNHLHYNYAVWEDGILSPIIYEALREESFAPQAEIQELEIEVARLERANELASVRTRTALDLAIETGRHEARSAWTDLTAKSDEAEAALDAARERLIRIRGSLSVEEQQERVRTLRASLDHPDEDVRFEARSKIKSAVHALVTDLTFSGPEQVGVTMTVGGDRRVSIDHDEIKGGTEWIMGRLDGRPLA